MNLQTEVANMRMTINTLQQQLATRTATINTLQQQATADAATINTLQATVAQQKTELARQQAIKAAVKFKFLQLKDEHTTLQAEAAAMQQQIKNDAATIFGLQNQLATRDITIQQLRDEVAELNTRNRQRKTAHAATRNECYSLKQQLKQATSMHDELQTELNRQLRINQSVKQRFLLEKSHKQKLTNSFVEQYKAEAADIAAQHQHFTSQLAVECQFELDAVKQTMKRRFAQERHHVEEQEATQRSVRQRDLAREATAAFAGIAMEMHQAEREVKFREQLLSLPRVAVDMQEQAARAVIAREVNVFYAGIAAIEADKKRLRRENEQLKAQIAHMMQHQQQNQSLMPQRPARNDDDDNAITETEGRLANGPAGDSSWCIVDHNLDDNPPSTAAAAVSSSSSSAVVVPRIELNKKGNNTPQQHQRPNSGESTARKQPSTEAGSASGGTTRRSVQGATPPHTFQPPRNPQQRRYSDPHLSTNDDLNSSVVQGTDSSSNGGNSSNGAFSDEEAGDNEQSPSQVFHPAPRVHGSEAGAAPDVRDAPDFF